MGAYRDWAKCLECGEREMVNRVRWFKASRPRCKACGGPLEKSEAAQEMDADRTEATNEQAIRIEKLTGIKKRAK